jgi:hypothetical protein
MMNLLGFRTDLRFDHGPAYPLTVTLQSVFARVAYDRLTANLSRNLGKSSRLALSVDAARLDSEGPEGTPVDAENFRIEGAVSFGRVLVPSLVLGANARGVAYTDEAPELGGPRLYWDPRTVVSGGLFAQWEKSLGDGWQLRGRINPSMAFIHERRRPGFEWVPHVSAEAGIAKVSGRFRISLDWFYYQGRFKGYRASGLQLSIAARDLLGGRRKR